MAKKGRSLPAYEDVVFNASLMLGNSHVSLGQPTRLPQNYKAIGGYHVDTDVKPLPQVRFIHFKMQNFVFDSFYTSVLGKWYPCTSQCGVSSKIAATEDQRYKHHGHL